MPARGYSSTAPRPTPKSTAKQKAALAGLKQSVARERAKVHAGKGVRSDSGDVTANTKAAPKRKGSYLTSKRYLEGGKSKPSTRRQLYDRRGRLAQEPGRSYIGMRLGRYDSKKHGVSDPVAQSVRRVLSKTRSPKEKGAALEHLQSLGLVAGGKQPDRKPTPKGPMILPNGDKVERGSGKITLKNPKPKSLGEEIDKQIGDFVSNTAKEVKGVAGAAQAILSVGSDKEGFKNPAVSGALLPERVKKAAIKTIVKGAAAGGGAIFEGLDRPVGAVESGLAKALAKAGAFHGKKRTRILAARTPREVLAHGRNWKKDVTGGDLTEAAGVGRKLGIGADVGLDPTMWMSVGLAPETGGASLAPLLARIKKVAPELMRSPEAVSALKLHERTHDDKALHAALSKLLTPSKRGALARAKVQQSTAATRKALDEAVQIRLKTNKARIKTGAKRKEEIKTTRVPVSNDAVALALRNAEGRRVIAQPRLSLATPTGRRTSIGVNLPVPGRLPVKRMSEATRNKLYDVAGRKEVAKLQEKRRLVIEDLEGRIGAAQRNRKVDTADKLRADLAEYKRTSASYSREQIRELGAEIVGKRRAMTLDEVAAQVNDRRVVAHPFKVASDEYARTTQAIFSKAHEDASTILKGSPEQVAHKVKRVQLYLIAKTENLGGHSVIGRAIQLAPDEQKYADNLLEIHRAQLEHGTKTGVLHRGTDDYVGMRVWENLDSPKDIGENVSNAIKNRSTTTGFQRHRSVASVTDHASEAELADSILRLADRPVSREQARDIAQELFVQGKHRSISELVARRIERGEEVRWDELTQTEKASVDWASRQGFLSTKGGDPIPLFKTPLTDPDTTEGLVLLANPERYGQSGDLANMAEGERALPQLLSLKKDAQQVAAMRSGLAPDQGDIAADLAAIESRLHDAASGVDPGQVLNRQVAEIRQLVDKGELADMPASDAIQKQLGSSLPDTLPEGSFSQVLDDKGNLWLRGPKSHDDPPIGGMPKRPAYDAGPLDDPFDFTSRLPDTREEGRMVVLDPRVTGYLRSKAQGATSGFNARWQAADKVLGRSVKEFDDRVAIAGEEEILQRDLITLRDENGQVTGYSERGEGGRVWSPDEVHFPESTLIPNHDRSFWTDPRDGQEYARPIDVLPSGLMMQEIGPDRLWPTQALDAMQHDMIKAGELDSNSKLDADFLDATFDVGVHHGFQKLMSSVRFGVTTPFPAYHVRNLISDLIKSLQADSGVLFHPVANAKLSAAAFHKGMGWKLDVPGMGKMEVSDFLFIADMFGVRSGHHIAEVMNMLKTGKFTESTVRKHINNSWFMPGGKSTKMGANREDMARYMTFLQAMRRNGGDAADAAFQMTRHHFNYNDLNRFERRTMRNIFLFYTWYRKNIPLQLVELARRPGFFAGVSHTYNSVEEGQTPLNIGPFAGAAPFQPGRPDYLKDKLQALTVSWKGYALNVGFGAPWGDLQWLSLEGVKDSPTMLTPMATIPMQQIFQIDPLTHRRYKAYEPGGAVSTLAPLYKLISGDELPRDEKGQPVLPWRLATLLRNLPLVGRATFAVGDVPANRDPGRLQSFGQRLNPITGLNINVAPRPGSGREAEAAAKDVAGRLVQGVRRQGLEDLSNLPKGSKTYLNALEEIQRRLDEDAGRHGTTKYLETTPQSGHYIKRKRRSTSSFGSTPLSGGVGGRSPLSP